MDIESFCNFLLAYSLVVIHPRNLGHQPNSSKRDMELYPLYC